MCVILLYNFCTIPIYHVEGNSCNLQNLVSFLKGLISPFENNNTKFCTFNHIAVNWWCKVILSSSASIHYTTYSIAPTLIAGIHWQQYWIDTYLALTLRSATTLPLHDATDSYWQCVTFVKRAERAKSKSLSKYMLSLLSPPPLPILLSINSRGSFATCTTWYNVSEGGRNPLKELRWTLYYAYVYVRSPSSWWRIGSNWPGKLWTPG